MSNIQFEYASNVFDSLSTGNFDDIKTLIKPVPFDDGILVDDDDDITDVSSWDHQSNSLWRSQSYPPLSMTLRPQWTSSSSSSSEPVHKSATQWASLKEELEPARKSPPLEQQVVEEQDFRPLQDFFGTLHMSLDGIYPRELNNFNLADDDEVFQENKRNVPVTPDAPNPRLVPNAPVRQPPVELTGRSFYKLSVAHHAKIVCTRCDTTWILVAPRPSVMSVAEFDTRWRNLRYHRHVTEHNDINSDEPLCEVQWKSKIIIIVDLELCTTSFNPTYFEAPQKLFKQKKMCHFCPGSAKVRVYPMMHHDSSCKCMSMKMKK